MTPVARSVADGEEDRLGFRASLVEGFVAPRIPVDRVVSVLQEVRRGGFVQAVGDDSLRVIRCADDDGGNVGGSVIRESS